MHILRVMIMYVTYNFSFHTFTVYNGYFPILLFFIIIFSGYIIFKNYNTINILTLITSQIFNKHIRRAHTLLSVKDIIVNIHLLPYPAILIRNYNTTKEEELGAVGAHRGSSPG